MDPARATYAIVIPDVVLATHGVLVDLVICGVRLVVTLASPSWLKRAVEGVHSLPIRIKLKNSPGDTQSNNNQRNKDWPIGPNLVAESH
jgi:hypothetical protein